MRKILPLAVVFIAAFFMLSALPLLKVAVGAPTAIVDLAISKIDSTDPVIAGNSLTYTLTVTNTGPEDAIDAVITDTLPISVTFISTSGECSHDAGTVTCNLAPVSVGVTSTVSITVQVDPSAGGILTNEASVGTSDDDLNEANNSTSEVTGVDTEADLAIDKTDGVTSVIAGDGITYTYQITVTNTGPSDAVSVVVTDTWPIGFNQGAVGTLDGICDTTTNAPDFSCDLETIGAGGTAVITATYTVPASIATGPQSNVVEVSSGTLDANNTNDTATDTNTVDAEADLSVVKVDDPDPVRAGGVLTYTVTVTNNGLSDASGVVLEDRIPGGVDFLSATPGEPTCTFQGRTVTCNLDSVAASETFPVTITVQVQPTVTGVIINEATISSDTLDPDLGNNTGLADTTVEAEADLSIDKTDGTDLVIAGGTLTYTLTITNSGPSDAVGLVVTDTLPGGVTYLSSTGGCSEEGGIVNCSLDSLAFTASTQLTITVDVAPSAIGVLTNTAEVFSGASDPNEANNSADDTTSVDAEADLSVTKTGSTDALAPGEVLTYTIEVTNNGLSDAQDVTMVDNLPDEVILQSVTTTKGTCPLADPVDCDLGALAASETVTVTINTIVDLAAGEGAISNASSVFSPTDDPFLGNNTDTFATIISGDLVDLQVAKSDSDDPVIAGGTLTYTIDVVNAGPSNASGVVVTDTLPGELTWVESTASQGTCAGLVCDLGGIVVSSGATITVVATVEPSAIGVITNTVMVSSTEDDRDTASNIAYEETVVVAEADLTIGKTGLPDPVIAGNVLTYTLMITNTGPSDAADLIVEDTLPEMVTYISSEPECTDVDGIVTCNLSSLAVISETQIITIVGRVVPSATEIITNTVMVSSSASDPDTTNNITSTRTTVNTEADVLVTKEADRDSIGYQVPLTYDLTVTNDGPSDSVGVTLTDTLPGEVVFIEASSFCVHNDGEVTCSIDNVAAGTSVQVSIVVSAIQGASGPLVNDVYLTAETTDTDSTNNDAQVSTIIDPELPTVTWTAPVGDGGRDYVGGEVVQLEVDAADNIGVERVYFRWWDYLDGEWVDIGSDSTSPYQWDFNTSVLNPGDNEIIAWARDVSGNWSPSRIWLNRTEFRIYLPLVTK